jgi:hypothetical protein
MGRVTVDLGVASVTYDSVRITAIDDNFPLSGNAHSYLLG